jgi:flagellar assembly factor FliW
MPLVETKYHGTLSYTEESVFDFPHGLPAFEGEKSFMLIQASGEASTTQGDTGASARLVFLQSMTRASLCFVAFPILVVDEKYELAIAPEDLEELGLEVYRQPVLGEEVQVLALVSLHAKFQATANLMAPVVLNVKSRRGLQAIRRDSRYSHAHSIGGQAGGQADRQQQAESTC